MKIDSHFLVTLAATLLVCLEFELFAPSSHLCNAAHKGHVHISVWHGLAEPSSDEDDKDKHQGKRKQAKRKTNKKLTAAYGFWAKLSPDN